MGSSGGSWEVVVAHREQWWLIVKSGGTLGSSGGLLVATPDCETAVLGLNQATSAYSGLLVLRWAAIWDST
jgi:hypothetical protein